MLPESEGVMRPGITDGPRGYFDTRAGLCAGMEVMTRRRNARFFVQK